MAGIVGGWSIGLRERRASSPGRALADRCLARPVARARGKYQVSVRARDRSTNPRKVNAVSTDDKTQRPFGEKLDREEGVLIEPDSGEVLCDPDEQCAPDDYVNDPDSRRSGIPGTVDDIPLSFGVESDVPAELHLVVEGSTRYAGRSRDGLEAEEDQGIVDERELWLKQGALLEEDSSTGLDLEGFSDDDAPSILEAMGDDAADALPDAPDGTSATGDASAPEHGGFPERLD
jgi:hypothetical protein